MSGPIVNNTERRSFFKWALFGTAALAAAVSGYGPALLRKEESLVVDLKDAANVITDASQGSHHRLLTTQHFLLANPVNAKDGQRVIWEIVQDASGGRQMALGDKFVFGADLKKAELSSAAHKRDFMTAIYNQAVDKWHVVAFIKGY